MLCPFLLFCARSCCFLAASAILHLLELGHGYTTPTVTARMTERVENLDVSWAGTGEASTLVPGQELVESAPVLGRGHAISLFKILHEMALIFQTGSSHNLFDAQKGCG